jgi:hypothetical protein
VRVRESLSDLIGKIISGVVVAQYPKGTPRSQLFITFSDGTAFEFWEDGQMLSMAKGLDSTNVDQLIARLEQRDGAQINVIRPSHEDPKAIQRDMLTDS